MSDGPTLPHRSKRKFRADNSVNYVWCTGYIKTRYKSISNK